MVIERCCSLGHGGIGELDAGIEVVRVAWNHYINVTARCQLKNVVYFSISSYNC